MATTSRVGLREWSQGDDGSDQSRVGLFDWEQIEGAGATGYTLTCDAGAFTIAGQDATLKRGRIVSADAGSYALAGQDATLTYTPAAGAYTLTCDAGAYSLAGQDAAFVYAPLNHYTLTAEAGAYQISGQAATFAFSGQPSFTGGGWAEWAKAEKRRRQKPAEEAMEAALEPVVSAPRKTITMASLIGKKAAAELAPFDSSAAVAISRRRKRQREDELLLLM